VLGASNLLLLFVSKALAAEQLVTDKAKLNLEVLQRQVSDHVIWWLHGRWLHAWWMHGRWLHARWLNHAWWLHAWCRERTCCTLHPPSRAPLAKHQPTLTPHPNRTNKNKQAKGLQAEYARATTAAAAASTTNTGSAGAGAANGGDEAARLRSQVDGLIREKNALQDIVEDALAAKKTAQAQVEAISAQSKVGQG